MTSPITSKKPAYTAIVATIAIAFGGLGIYAATRFNDTTQEQNAAPVALAPAQSTVTSASSPWAANPMLMAHAELVTASNSQSSITNDSPGMMTVAMKEVTPEVPAESGLTPAMMARMELSGNFVPVSAEGSTENAPFGRIQLDAMSSGQNAITQLGGSLDAVAKWYGMSSAAFRQLLLSDKSVHVDTKGRVLHIDEETVIPGAANGTTMATAAVTASVATAGGASPFPFDQTFKLHTKPDSTRVLYLNFTGQGSNPAFDLDKAPATFSDAERLVIQKVLLRVAEAYAAFDVDITTEAPAVPAGKIGATILITPQSSSAGGYAYLNSFSKFAAGAAPAFCFPNNLANAEKYISDCVSHELGHTLGLNHQGQLPSSAYYAGQGTGETGWAPIMGVGYYKNLPQWSKGEYANANNKEDAYAVMLARGLSPRADDHGDTIPFADALVASNANGLSNLSGLGRIEKPDDVDMFSFVAGAGPVNLKVGGAILGSTLDISLKLLDVNGKVLATSSPTATTLSKTISASIPTGGVYYLSVSGAGRGDAKTTGYTNYGNLGEYNISGTSALSTLPALAPAIRTSAVSGKAPLAIKFDAITVVTSATGDFTSHQWNFGDATPVVAGTSSSHTFTKAGTYDVVLKSVNKAGVTFVKGVKITIS
ncbi:PKD domain-containing protein [Actimicrobium sp. CCI2.3]|uniref:PKD domain-containing protein n=1 Tax=Actimicrobium sp. CCI2.3 TaxID=3048616 RepID=UPI002AB5A9BC|nr:PKD domain-containing protein [Actimicrobium sp. CCI2.3]MDY7573770.1 PKD domain-containing protein [Actimicrobium sp. CCI2.3]MEB0022381.1 PKD domain-containing protein [Actimicrobium sp. CCI2.3]